MLNRKGCITVRLQDKRFDLHRAILFAVLVLIFCASSASATDLVITNARVFTGTDAPIIERANIVIAGGRIEKISLDRPFMEDVKVIDADGRIVMPGLIDTHVHLFFDLQNGATFPTSDAEASRWMDGRVRNLLGAYLRAGFTTILSPIDFWPEIAAVRDGVNAGLLVSPRLLIAGAVFVAPGGHYICKRLEGAERSWCDNHISVQMTSYEAVREAVSEHVRRDVDILVLDSVTNAPVLQEDAISAFVKEADQHELKVLVHTSTAEQVDSLVGLGVDGFLHPPSGLARLGGSQFELAGSLTVPVAMTIGEQEELIQIGQATNEVALAYEQSLRNVQQLMTNGALIVYGSDMPGAKPETTLPIVLRALSGLGLSNEDILRAMTRDAAQGMLGLSDVGTIEPGSVADLIILDGDPLEDLAALTRVHTVIQQGRVVVR